MQQSDCSIGCKTAFSAEKSIAPTSDSQSTEGKNLRSLDESRASGNKDVCHELDTVMTDIRNGLITEDATFVAAVSQFFKRYKKLAGLSSDRGTRRACHLQEATNYVGLFELWKGRGMSSKCSRKHIRVQPTAVSRRAKSNKHKEIRPASSGRRSSLQTGQDRNKRALNTQYSMPKRQIRGQRIHGLQKTIEDRLQNAT